MSNFCPVCKSVINDDTVKCSVCNFTDLHREFITKEDAQEWLDSVVLPYREEWNNKKKRKKEHIKKNDIIDFIISDDSLLRYIGLKTDVKIPVGVKKIDKSAFDFRTRIESVTIPSGVVQINSKSFYKCLNLKKISIPDSVIYIFDKAFCYCVSLESITLPTGLKLIGSQVFYNCHRLKRISIPDSVKRIGAGAFYGCSKLTIHCQQNSYAHKYATENNIRVQFID